MAQKVHWVHQIKEGGVFNLGYATMNRELMRATQLLGLEWDITSKIAFHACSPRVFRPQRGKTNIVFCLAPETKVLKSDLRWVPIWTIRPGDELIAFDEDLGKTNKLRRSVVLDTSRQVARRIRVTTDDGRQVIATGNHQWVVSRRYKKRPGRRWVKTEDLRVGDKLAVFRSPWEHDTTYDAGWMSGILDGEGYVSNCGNGDRLGFAQNPGPVLERALRILDTRGFTYNISEDKKCRQVQIHDSIRALGTFRPTRLIPKSTSLWEGLRSWNLKDHPVQVVAIEELPPGEVIGLSTSTKTVIAEGILSHNTMWESPQFPLEMRPYLTAADLIVVPSQFVKDIFQEILGPDMPIRIVPLGVHPEIFTSKRRVWNPGTPFMWLNVGAPNDRKGWSSIEQLWQQSDYPQQSDRLFFYGKTTHNNPDIVRTMLMDGWESVTEDVVRKGNFLVDYRKLPLKHLVETYHNAHGFLYPTAAEGFGLTLLEAMATGLPCLVTKYSGVLDFTDDSTVRYLDYILLDGDNEELTPKDGIDMSASCAFARIDSIYEQMEWVMNHYSQALKMGKRAARKAREYTWERSAKGLLRIFAELS